MPHAGFFQQRTQSSEFDPTDSGQPLDFIVKSGRALVVIAFDGTFERYWPPSRRQSMSRPDRYRTWVRHFRQEVGRTLDYLGTRDDLDLRRLGWYSESFGSQTMVSMLALEKRFSAAVLVGGGVFPQGLAAAEEAYNHLPRITQPVLMLNGRWDIDVNLDAQNRQFELLGTPSDRKKHMLFDAGHGTLPHNHLVRASLEWYDRYLGPTRATPDTG
jgi:pimeloyl-ACP methyl ester carboxylesterase